MSCRSHMPLAGLTTSVSPAENSTASPAPARPRLLASSGLSRGARIALEAADGGDARGRVRLDLGDRLRRRVGRQGKAELVLVRLHAEVPGDHLGDEVRRD